MTEMVQNPWQPRLAFTLIELLVVIAIIFLLAAILFPVFSQVRENSRRSACMSNLQQIGIGVMQYSQDFDEKYPFRGVEFPDPPAALPQLLVSYTKSSQIFLCPSDPRATGSFSNYLSTVYSTNTQYPMSYYYHFCFYHIFQDPTGTSPAIYGYPKSVSASMVTFPAQKAMMDCVLSDDGLLDTTGKTYPPHRPGFILSLFADGHVKNVSFADCPNNTTYGYIPYGSTHTLYCNFDWTPWGVRSVNGTGGIDLKN